MQLKWILDLGSRYFKTKVFDNYYSVTTSRHWPSEEKPWIVISGAERVRDGFETKEDAMVAAHQIIEKELEKGYIGKVDVANRFKAKLSYIPEDMFGCKKALALFTNENGDEYIDSVLVSATIPKGSLVREVDPEHHNDLPDNGICRKCRSDRAIIVDILEPMCVRAGEIYSLPSRKTQRKKIPIISVHIVKLALKKYFIMQQGVHGYYATRMQYRDESTILRKLMQKFLSMLLGFNNDTRIFVEWLSKITDPRFPVSLDLAITARLMEPYKDAVNRYQNDPYMLYKVLLARILRDIGIMDIALKYSYKIGDKIQIDDFDLSNNACGAGFHFFKTAIEAWNYKFN